jgi:IS5 family transposase
MDRNFLTGTDGDAANAVLAAVGYNVARLIAWLRELWRALLPALVALALLTPHPLPTPHHLRST